MRMKIKCKTTLKQGEIYCLMNVGDIFTPVRTKYIYAEKCYKQPTNVKLLWL